MSDVSMRTIKRLFAESGNQCAFPRCSAPLIDAASGVVVADVCHIKAASPDGPRYDPRQPDLERHGYDNLVALCLAHHRVIDDDVDSYTVARLVRMKAAHRDRGLTSPNVGDDLLQQLVRGATVNVGAVNITSINQSGGQVAHTINNVGPPCRSITEGARLQALLFLRANPQASITFASTQGDLEADSFKQQLMGLFRDGGWQVFDGHTFMFFGAQRGVVVTIPRGAPEQGMPQVVAHAISLAGSPVTGNYGDMANATGFYVQVWHAP
jgi:hypothetical protein